MRFRPRFSLRTLLIAVLCVAVGCWYFNYGTLFNEQASYWIKKRIHANSQEQTLIAFVKQHRFLPHSTRLQGVLIDVAHKMQPFTPNPRLSIVRNKVGTWTTDEGAVVLTFAGWIYRYEIQPSGLTYDLGEFNLRVWSENWQPGDPHNGPHYDYQTPKSVKASSRPIRWSELNRYIEDDSVGEWSVGSLEKWLAEHQ
jgi:hypothetical protein